MKLYLLGTASMLLAIGCMPAKGVATVGGPGTHVVRGPGAVTVVHGERSCTMPVAGSPHGHAKGMPKGKGMGKGGHAPPHGMPSRPPGNPMDTMMFRLCEARSNGDITEPQYQELLNKLFDTMAKMANRGPMGGMGRGPGHQGPWGRGGMGRGRHRGPGGAGPGRKRQGGGPGRPEGKGPGPADEGPGPGAPN